MNGYDLSRRWFDFAFENQDKVLPRHGILYFWLIELNNRLGWVENFKIPLDTAGAAIGIARLQTTRETLLDLVSWGFVKMIIKSPNQYIANVISLRDCFVLAESNLDFAISLTENRSSTVHASFEQPIEQCLSTVQAPFEQRLSTVHINKQLNLETIKPINLETSADRAEIKEGFEPPQEEEVNPPPKVPRKGSSKFDPLTVELPHQGEEFKKVWSDWTVHRKQTRRSLTEKSVIEQLKLLSCYTETIAIKMILKSITSGWQGIFPIKENGNGNQLNQTNPVNGVSDRLQGAWELIAEHHKNN